MSGYDKIVNYKSHSEIDGVIINKLGIKDPIELEKQERIITSTKLGLIYMRENNFKFSIEYYLNIHKEIFEDIYPFAGCIRDEIIEKRIPFCLPEYIYDNLEYVLKKAEIDAYKIKNRDDLLDYLCNLYSNLDIIHPFREGNGRTEREFIRECVEYLNSIIDFGCYEINYNSALQNKKSFINAIIIADARCDMTYLKKFMDIMIVEKEKEKTI